MENQYYYTKISLMQLAGFDEKHNELFTLSYDLSTLYLIVSDDVNNDGLLKVITR
jgi:hypothetical protein